jgi:hypothetical protein
MGGNAKGKAVVSSEQGLHVLVRLPSASMYG